MATGRRARARHPHPSKPKEGHRVRGRQHTTATRHPLTFAAAQAAVMAGKRRHGFSTTDVEAEFGLLLEEAGEAHGAWRKHCAPRPSRRRRLLAWLRLRRMPAPLADPAPVRHEIADILLFTLAVADMLGINAGDAVGEKLQVNAQRTYRSLANGTRVRQPAVPAQAATPKARTRRHRHEGNHRA